MNPDDRSNGKSPPIEPGSVAEDRFVHGLLGHLHLDTGEACEARIAAVIDRVKQGETQHHATHRRLFARLVPLASAAALLLAVTAFLVFSSQPTAHAMVGEAIRATQLASHLRYEISITDPVLYDGEPQLVGAMDMRGSLLLVQIEAPHGHDFVMGRDEQGDWSIRRDGSVERADPKHAAPRWINLGDSTVLVGGLDALLDQLREDDFSIDRGASPADGQTQLIATRRQGASRPGPDRFFIWIDDDTSLVERLELRWSQHAPPVRPSSGRRPRGEQPGPGGDGPHPPRGDRPPHPHHPELIREGPFFGERRHPPPPDAIVFQRVDLKDIRDGHFSPPAP